MFCRDLLDNEAPNSYEVLNLKHPVDAQLEQVRHPTHRHMLPWIMAWC
jgi:hypothetical protein